MSNYLVQIGWDLNMEKTEDWDWVASPNLHSSPVGDLEPKQNDWLQGPCSWPRRSFPPDKSSWNHLETLESGPR